MTWQKELLDLLTQQERTCFFIWQRADCLSQATKSNERYHKMTFLDKEWFGANVFPKEVA